jgi:hypothetical protein
MADQGMVAPDTENPGTEVLDQALHPETGTAHQTIRAGIITKPLVIGFRRSSKDGLLFLYTLSFGHE